jgi:hypothetical protein
VAEADWSGPTPPQKNTQTKCSFQSIQTWWPSIQLSVHGSLSSHNIYQREGFV